MAAESEVISLAAEKIGVFFKRLADCGIVFNYTVQLQAVSLDLELELHFYAIISDFVKDLQDLLSKFPSVNENVPVDATTQTIESEQSDTVYQSLKEGTSRENTLTVQTAPHTFEEQLLVHLAKGARVDEIKSEIIELGENSLNSLEVENVDEDLEHFNGGYTLVRETQKSSYGDERESAVNQKHRDIYTSVKPSSENVCDEGTVSVPDNQKQAPCDVVLKSKENTAIKSTISDRTYKSDLGPKCQDISSNGSIVELHMVFNRTDQQENSVTLTPDIKNETNVDILNVDTGHCDKKLQNSCAVCCVCLKVCETSEELQQHLLNDHKQSDTSGDGKNNVRSLHRNLPPCDICHQEFSTLKYLRHHVLSIHGLKRAFLCPICKTRFSSWLALKRHKQRHIGVERYECSYCEKSFIRQDYLDKHLLMHSDTRPYSCHICKKEYRTKSNLNNHSRIHTGEKDYACDLCESRFYRVDKLKDHMLRHLKIKRFQCTVCKKEYAEKRDLKTHLHSQHKM